MNKKGKFLGFVHVQLAAPVGSEEKVRDFFGGILGLKEIPKPVNLRKEEACGFKSVRKSYTSAWKTQEHFIRTRKLIPHLESKMRASYVDYWSRRESM